MTRLRADFFSISLDGYGAGPNQSFEYPLGIGGESLHDWFVVTRSFRLRDRRDSRRTQVRHGIGKRERYSIVRGRGDNPPIPSGRTN